MYRRISDERFIGLIWKALRAGYLWRKEPGASFIGTPQGSVASPILANIYLHELDLFVEGLQQKYEKGSKRKDSPEYHRVNYRRQRALKRSGGIMTPEIRALTKQMRSLPSMDTFDPGFVRVKYIRYADDWIVGVTGPRSLAEQIKDNPEYTKQACDQLGQRLAVLYLAPPPAFLQPFVRAIRAHNNGRIVARVGIAQPSRRAIQLGVEKCDEAIGVRVLPNQRIQTVAKVVGRQGW